MMKKSIQILLILAILIATLCPTMSVNAASKTLKDYKNAVAALEAKKQENQRKSAQADASIDAKRNAIVNANNQIAANEKSVEEAKVKVAESQEKIKIKEIELEDTINAMQYTETNSSELYITYVLTSESIPELIERQAVVEQVITYIKGELESLYALIKENEQLQIDLTNQNTNLSNSIVTYNKQVEELEAYIDSLYTIGLDYDDQINAQKNLIKMFESAGCKDSDSVDACYYNKNGSSSFSRPLDYGVITQAWGTNGHKGMDIGGNKAGTAIYAPADGTVVYVQDGPTYLKKKGYKSCGGNIIYAHYYVNGVAYTTEMAHLTAYYVKAGDKIKKGQLIATVGGDSATWWYDKCTTGTHLHYAIAYGLYLGAGSNGYSSWSTFQTNTKATNVQSITGIKNQRGYKFTSRY